MKPLQASLLTGASLEKNGHLAIEGKGAYRRKAGLCMHPVQIKKVVYHIFVYEKGLRWMNPLSGYLRYSDAFASLYRIFF